MKGAHSWVRLVDTILKTGRNAFFALLLSINLAVAGADSRPSLFFYPPPYHYSDGQVLDSPQTVTVEQSTERVPFIPDMSGVVVIVYWSLLCPAEHQCNFSLIDHVLDYWSKKGKKIVLSVATIGYPIVSTSNRQEIETATPPWVLKNIRTYRYPSRLLGSGSSDASTSYAYPDFRDPAFLRLTWPLVRDLASRYDGNPNISQIRVGTGLMGEENPLVGPISMPMAGYQESEWISYCKAVLKQYEMAFKKSELEFDISRFPAIRAKGRVQEKSMVDAFMTELLQAKVFVAFDGLQSQDDDLMGGGSDSKDGRAQALRYLAEHKRKGGHVGLEAIGRLSNPRMGTTDLHNVEKLAHVISIVNPDRLVFFNDVDSAVQSTNDPQHAAELLRKIGFTARPN